MDKKVSRYYQLKNKQKEIEQEMAGLRDEILKHCEAEGVSELDVGSYKVKLVLQERKEYDENKLYEVLSDPELWRLLSRPDASKIASLIKLRVVSEDTIKDACAIKSVTLLQINKK